MALFPNAPWDRLSALISIFTSLYNGIIRPGSSNRVHHLAFEIILHLLAEWWLCDWRWWPLLGFALEALLAYKIVVMLLCGLMRLIKYFRVSSGKGV